MVEDADSCSLLRLLYILSVCLFVCGFVSSLTTITIASHVATLLYYFSQLQTAALSTAVATMSSLAQLRAQDTEKPTKPLTD